MYNLSKAKEEIDAVARHATDIATHMLAMSDDVAAKLDSFRTELLGVIEAKFTELKQAVHGDGEIEDSGALTQLGAKMALFARGMGAPDAGGEQGTPPEAGLGLHGAAAAAEHGEAQAAASEHGQPEPGQGDHGQPEHADGHAHGDEHRPEHGGEHHPY